ncbi:rhodanese-like domain-containing protein [Herbaspirillum sp. RTI4]|uniref:rhodanese-like domain-containing protein n=1 Tax=Herbaspirillum sp. RTI4 TaxID=3048640 RepID=UPI002AB3ADB5|nr:rhodanese-like domain-containing protein [Herbaspirillum sp. RTI4]MDY7579663.1 rhodanese-like domain-containing protein [Herbaspirillum sp. RTI4]MEA9981878.1 rhodanese-like domain-containing protein [Herbaspirillum sp. RTI4]
MTSLPPIIASAIKSGSDQQLSYAGAVSPHQAFSLLQSNANIFLIDVRTKAERDWVGQVALPPAQHFSVQWNLYPEGRPNPHFLDELHQIAADRENVLLFLCRSGVRSKAAATAATKAGYRHCFDILQGFEGGKDAQGHRKMIDGWCYAGLPWTGA